MTDQHFANNFAKGPSKNISVKLFQNRTSGFGEEDFSRISSCPYGARSPHSPDPCLWTDQIFANNLLKGSPKEHSCGNYFKIGPAVPEILKNCLKNSISLPWKPEFLMESNSVNKEWIFPGTFLPNLVQIG